MEYPPLIFFRAEAENDLPTDLDPFEYEEECDDFRLEKTLLARIRAEGFEFNMSDEPVA